LKEKCLNTTVICASLKARYLHITVATVVPLKVESLHKAVAIVGLFESVGLTHYSCYRGPFESRVFTQGRPARYSCCYWGPFESKVA